MTKTRKTNVKQTKKATPKRTVASKVKGKKAPTKRKSTTKVDPLHRINKKK